MAKVLSRNRRAHKNKNSTLWLVGGLAVAVIIVLALVALNLNAQNSTAAAPNAPNSGRVLGSPSAPVTIDEYADFQCPVCRQAEQTIRALAPKYIDTGEVKVVFHNFAFIGPESLAAANAAECANDQGKFWNYAFALYDHQTGENVGAFSPANLKQFAANLGLDTPKFNACVDTNAHAQQIQQEYQAGQARGIQATPSFYFNGQFVQGLLSPDQFTAKIDSLLPKH